METGKALLSAGLQPVILDELSAFTKVLLVTAKYEADSFCFEAPRKRVHISGLSAGIMTALQKLNI